MKKGLLFLVGISILFCSCSRRTKVDIETYEKEIDLLLNEIKARIVHLFDELNTELKKMEE